MDVRTKNVTRNKMDKFEHKLVKMKHVSPFKSLAKHALGLNYLANTCF